MTKALDDKFDGPVPFRFDLVGYLLAEEARIDKYLKIMEDETMTRNSREIKFRAWDKIDKVMREVACINFYDEVVRLDEYADGSCIRRRLSEVVLMQTTGLKDKNGKEINEGDIVKFTMDIIAIPAGKIGEEECVAAIEASDEFNIEGHYGGWKLSVPNASIEYVTVGEVVGNIYANPELLNDTQ